MRIRHNPEPGMLPQVVQPRAAAISGAPQPDLSRHAIERLMDVTEIQPIPTRCHEDVR